MNSEEYQRKSQQVVPTTLTGDEAPIEIDKQADTDALFDRIRSKWAYLGKVDPFWSVKSFEEFRLYRMEANWERFFSLGERDMDVLLAALSRNGVTHDKIKRCFEFGCGVGRVTGFLADQFDSVVGVDVSERHLNIARHNLQVRNADHVTLHQLSSLSDLEALSGVDLVYSINVLQHNPPPLAREILRHPVGILNPGGIAYFQLMTYVTDYRFKADDYTADTAGRRSMELHVLPQAMVFDTVVAEGGRVLEVREDDSLGTDTGSRSNVFLVSKN